MSNGINAPYGLMVVQSQIGNGGTQKLGKYNIYASANGQNTYAGNIFQGDLVRMSPALNDLATTFAAGTIGTIVAGYIPVANAAATVVTGVPVGIFVGCQFYDATTRVLVNSDYWPASRQVMAGTAITAFVNDDPEVVFKVQISTSTNNAAIVGLNNVSPYIYQNLFRGQNAFLQVGGVPFTAPIAPNTPTNNPATGNTSNGKSAYYLDGSTIVITALGGDGGINKEIKILGLASQNLSSPNPTGLTPGVNMPFVDVLCKFNVHIHGSTGTPGVKLTA
jgi:hypothetical protein